MIGSESGFVGGAPSVVKPQDPCVRVTLTCYAIPYLSNTPRTAQ